MTNVKIDQTTQKTAALAAIALAGCLFGAGSANAELIVPGTYRLHNHPDGNEAPPTYGLRLDELIDVTDNHDVFTFDFDAPGAEMNLEYDGTDITISGVAFGGLDLGGEYDPANSGFVNIQFTYSNLINAPGDDDLIVDAPNGSNTGAISWQDTGESIALFDYRGDNEFSFRFGDEDDNLGHREFDGISGWGWLNHGDRDWHVEASDWLFTGTLVPAPGAIAFLGVAGLAGRRRRRA